MNKLIITCVVAVPLIGCNSEDGATTSISDQGIIAHGINTSLKTATYTIDDSNGVRLSQSGLDNIDFAKNTQLFSPEPQTQLRNATGVFSRTTEIETEACDSGSITMTASSDDIDESSAEMPANGSLGVLTVFKNCVESYATDRTETNGSMYIEMSWQGYSTTTNEFDSIEMSIVMGDFEVVGTEIGSTFVHGTMDMAMSSSETHIDWSLSVSSDETNGEIVNTQTTSTIVMGLSDFYPTSGAWVFKGANNTAVTGTIDANGIEVSINGAPATLEYWY